MVKCHFWVCLVRGIEKQEDRKLWKDKKWEDRKDFIFSPICLVESEKNENMEKMSLNKFTHILLLNNDV